MAIQQMAPRTMDFPLDLTMATTICFETDGTHGHDNENLEDCLRGVENYCYTERGMSSVW